MVLPFLPLAAGLFVAKKLYDYVTDVESSTSSYETSSFDLEEAIEERDIRRKLELTNVIATNRSSALKEIEKILKNKRHSLGKVNIESKLKMAQFSFSVKQAHDALSDSDEVNQEYEKKRLPRKFKIEFKELSESIQALKKARTILDNNLSDDTTDPSATYILDFGPDCRTAILKNSIKKYGERAGIDVDDDYDSFDDPFIEELEKLNS
eukprot:TRINITY_DN31384_c0_g1_i1.p1 TRINITY_DN31384_c0_g1~~TRINITY_DN31384_c0_g1_i1.p1  ORF type:complete len:209 (+),score=0.93 TRINITY_DN31384_c0_g1_i1:108-734(+)